MVSGISSNNDTTAAAAAMKQSTGMNKDDFLKLFVTQLQHQDPMKPENSSEFISQLAQLTQVEQSYNTNSNLQDILTVSNNAASLSAVSFIGKEVSAPGPGVNLTASGPTTINFNLAAAASDVTVTIKDVRGATVKTLTGGARNAGNGSLVWDGTDNSNNQMPAGVYNVSVSAVTGGGERFSGIPLVIGRVDGLKIEGGKPLLTIGGLEVMLSDVYAVKGGV
jgi:flagellar basal-body rod modification protein FlgD